MTRKLFATRLRAARLEKGMDALGLAQAVGMQSRQATHRWEEGTRMPDLETLVRIARVLDKSTDWLLGTEDLSGQRGPEDSVDLDEVMVGGSVCWRGRILARNERRRTWAVLHALLAPVEEIGYPQQMHKDKPEQEMKSNRLRAREIIASGHAERPRPRTGADQDGSVGQGDAHGTA